MNLAILITNTDDSAFAAQHSDDCEKFSDLIHAVRPDWELAAYSVKDGIFPENTDQFDGLIITGSPASVHDDFPWISKLENLILSARSMEQPMFGACFGHQVIARALGGKVGNNPAGWVWGTVLCDVVGQTKWTQALPSPHYMYAAHKEQVLSLPKGALIISTQKECSIAGFMIDDLVYTTQYHPEMSHEFMSALTDEVAHELPEQVIVAAKSSLTKSSDYIVFAESIARFFEVATPQQVHNREQVSD